MNLLKIYILFWIFSLIGWIMEVIVCSYSLKKIQNRGFLLGPYCPIYGFGGISMLLFLPFKDNPLICFILCMIICSIIEYFTSYLMEKMFKIRWWDYSEDKFNINGRICLRNALAFGALGLLLTRYLYPVFENFINLFSNTTLIIISIILFIITTIDIIVSFSAIYKLKNIINKNINSFKNIDATEKIKKLIKKNLDIGYIEKRLINIYTSISKKINNYKHLLIIMSISLVLGVILTIIYKNSDIIPLVLSIGVLLSYIISKTRRSYDKNNE